MSDPEQVCECGHGIERHDGRSVTTDLCRGGTPGFCGCTSFRPAAPSAPVVAGPGPCDRSPAEQDDERAAVERIAAQYRDPTIVRFAINDFRDWLAARPSADTETVRVAELERLLLVERDARDRDQATLQRVRDVLDRLHILGPAGLDHRIRAALDAR